MWRVSTTCFRFNKSSAFRGSILHVSGQTSFVANFHVVRVSNFILLFQPQMDIPADRVRWAPQILEEEQEDMVDSPTPPGPDPSVEAVREASGDKSWHVLSEGAASGSTGDVSQMHDLQQHVQ